jgi:DhnA family fructose-bisphosphate aldolase class Ia
MEKVVKACPSRVVIQGGDVGNTAEDYIKMTREALDVGVGGVTFGRFVWEYRDITSLVKTLRSVIHEGISVKEAVEMLSDLESDAKKA